MHFEQALIAIDQARTQGDVLRVLKDYVHSPYADCAHWLDREILDASDVAEIALELTRTRLTTLTTPASLVNAEVVFARACVKNAALLDSSGAWKVYRARTGAIRKGGRGLHRPVSRRRSTDS
jgi:hypothetical protein